jgi:NitT/TauT family transport system substrate-binding protein
MAIMAKGDAAASEAKAAMGKAAGTDLAGYEKQLKATRLFIDPAEAAAFVKGADLPKTMDLVRTFSFEHGILGEGAKSVDAVGIAFPDGKVLGDKKNVKMRFSAEFSELAAAGKL